MQHFNAAVRWNIDPSREVTLYTTYTNVAMFFEIQKRYFHVSYRLEKEDASLST